MISIHYCNKCNYELTSNPAVISGANCGCGGEIFYIKLTQEEYTALDRYITKFGPAKTLDLMGIYPYGNNNISLMSNNPYNVTKDMIKRLEQEYDKNKF